MFKVTETRISLVDPSRIANDRILAFASITIDDAIVVKDLRIIRGAKGLLICMPSRKIARRCDHCGAKNAIFASFCSGCGRRLELDPAAIHRDRDGRKKVYADIVHPIIPEARAYIEDVVLAAYHDEVELAKEPGYRPREFGAGLDVGGEGEGGGEDAGWSMAG